MKLFRLRMNSPDGNRTFRVTGENTPLTQRCAMEEGNFLLAIDSVEGFERGGAKGPGPRASAVEELLRMMD